MFKFYGDASKDDNDNDDNDDDEDDNDDDDEVDLDWCLPHDWVSPPLLTFLITKLDLTCFLSTPPPCIGKSGTEDNFIFYLEYGFFVIHEM